MAKLVPSKIFFFLFAFINSHAQKGIDGLIKAEKDFAAYSVANGTKDAFLKFADSAGIVWSPEIEMPVNAIETWTKREKRPGKLDWQPQYAEVAISQDFGYTTGPFTFSRNDSVLTRGEYVTIWRVSKNGEWKFVIDLGVNNTPEISAPGLEKISAEKHPGNAASDEMLKAEEDFIASFASDRKMAYEKYLSEKSILKRNGRQSATNKKLQKEIISDDPQDTGFRVLGSGTASSGDLGYIFGNMTSGVKQYGHLRIWRREKTGWKIALEVLRY